MNEEKARMGLTSAQAAERAAAGQSNRLPDPQGGIAPILARHVFTLFNLLNVLVALAMLWVRSWRNMLFMGVVISNTLIGVVQEVRAKKQHDKLKLLAQAPLQTLRDGAWGPVAPDELVKDDVIRLSRGDQIPADGTVLDGEVRVDESLLTGESVPVLKHAGDALYGGTFPVSGSCTALLTAVGRESTAGRLQCDARKIKRGKSMLMRDLNTVIRVVSAVVLPLGIGLCLLQISRGTSLSQAMQGSAASVLGLIPEGLVLLTSVSLTAGVLTLGKRQTLVNELYGIECLARVDVLCTDKTGTLTSGNMCVESVETLGNKDRATELLHAVCQAFVEETPTNRAIRALCDTLPIEAEPQVVRCVPFSSETRTSAAYLADGSAAILGAPEKLLTGELLEQAHVKAAGGLRVLALCKRQGDTTVPMALICVRDELRKNVQETVDYFLRQGVTLKVISGDSDITVSSIALAAGIPNTENRVDMSTLGPDADYDSLCESCTVFGRAAPEQKRALMEALKRRGHSPAMLGDGVNDIPALKAADCAIVMPNGSPAASCVSHIDLLDGDFSHLPAVVNEGRRVVNNIARAGSLYLIKNIFTLICTLALLVLPYAYPFMPIQLTLVGALTIGAPSLVLAIEPNEKRIEGNFLRRLIRSALPGGIVTAAAVLAALIITDKRGFTLEQIRTVCTLIAGASGMASLIRVCIPFTPLRIALCAVMAGAFVGAVLLLGGLFVLVPLPPVCWAAAAAALPVCLVLQCLLALPFREKSA